MIGDFCSSVLAKVFEGKEEKKKLKIKYCTCDKDEEGHCKLMMSWIEEFYDWKTDNKFLQTYQHYCRKSSIVSNRQITLGRVKSSGMSESFLFQTPPRNENFGPMIESSFDEDSYQIRLELNKILKNLRMDEVLVEESNFLFNKAKNILVKVLQIYRKHA